AFVDENRKGIALKSPFTLNRWLIEASDKIHSPSFVTIQTEFGEKMLTCLIPERFPCNNSSVVCSFVPGSLYTPVPSWHTHNMFSRSIKIFCKFDLEESG